MGKARCRIQSFASYCDWVGVGSREVLGCAGSSDRLGFRIRTRQPVLEHHTIERYFQVDDQDEAAGKGENGCFDSRSSNERFARAAGWRRSVVVGGQLCPKIESHLLGSSCAGPHHRRVFGEQIRRAMAVENWRHYEPLLVPS